MGVEMFTFSATSKVNVLCSENRLQSKDFPPLYMIWRSLAEPTPKNYKNLIIPSARVLERCFLL